MDLEMRQPPARPQSSLDQVTSKFDLRKKTAGNRYDDCPIKIDLDRMKQPLDAHSPITQSNVTPLRPTGYDRDPYNTETVQQARMRLGGSVEDLHRSISRNNLIRSGMRTDYPMGRTYSGSRENSPI